MAGRYIREAVRQRVRLYVDYDPIIVITGLSNTYTHYITTELEYDVQRYEAGSVIYGRNTLAAYTIEMEKMVDNRVRRAQALRPAALVPLPCLPGGSGTGTHIFKNGGSGTAAALNF